jgi:hypothetical protein
MQRLRDTRSAIQALGDEDFRDQSVAPKEQPFAFVKDPRASLHIKRGEGGGGEVTCTSAVQPASASLPSPRFMPPNFCLHTLFGVWGRGVWGNPGRAWAIPHLSGPPSLLTSTRPPFANQLGRGIGTVHDSENPTARLMRTHASRRQLDSSTTSASVSTKDSRSRLPR